MPCNCEDILWEDIITADDDNVVDGDTTEDDADTGTPDEIVDRLKVYLDNKFTALSRVFNKEDYVIPEIFEYSVVKDVDYDYVYNDGEESVANQRYIVMLSIGKARYRIVGSEATLQRKILDAMNGMVMILRCGLEVVE